jgi:uncharacterized membrane protein YoaT (DUF817 family)
MKERLRIKKAFFMLWDFGLKQLHSCLFPAFLFAVLGLTQWLTVPGLHRYDLILVLCLAFQWWMFQSGRETADELKVIAVFHAIGLALELYKVHMGSWSYPQEGWSKIGGVPLYSGFMYASVASYMCQAWRRLELQLTGWPSGWWTIPLGAAIYFNFFTHHYIWDIRWILTILIFVVFLKTRVYFIVRGSRLQMPLSISFILIGFFIWIAENLATLLGAWQYPDQQEAWTWVHISKISSWFLLVIVSFLIIAQLKHVKDKIDGYTQKENSLNP